MAGVGRLTPQVNRLNKRDLFKLLSSRVEEAQGITHIMAGDFNASLLGEYRKGYASNSSSRQSDMLFNDFVCQPRLQRRWWTGQLIEGMWTRRNPSQTQLSRIDELLILNKAELPVELHARTGGGHGYQMHVLVHGDSRLDHYTLVADIPVNLLPKCQHWPPVTKVDTPDLRAWEKQQDNWRMSTLRAYVPPNSTDPHEVLNAWIKAAASQIPMRTRSCGGLAHPRPPMTRLLAEDSTSKSGFWSESWNVRHDRDLSSRPPLPCARSLVGRPGTMCG